MTDYWKSYAKKFCEICKCWYADNKISIERHEMGAKHKVMVQQRLRESAKKAKDKEVANHDLRMTLLAMEQAAKVSMGGDGRQREVPTSLPLEESIIDEYHPTKRQTIELEEVDIKDELRDQRRKLKELKKNSKQSKLWVDDQKASPKEAQGESTDDVLWVQTETPGGVRYYWHIFSGETRWDQPTRFYNSEEYAERYSEIASEIAMQNHFIAAESISAPTTLDQIPSSSRVLTTANEYSGQMISPQSAPQMTTKDGWNQKSAPIKREYEGGELSKEERRRIKRERRAMAEAEGPPQLPEGLVELKHEMQEEQITVMASDSEEGPKPVPIAINEPDEEIGHFPSKSHPLGPWIPVKKETPKSHEPMLVEQRKEKGKTKLYDDLPEQEYGPGSAMLAQAPSELLEIAEMDPEELAFKPKETPQVEVKKKSSKVVGFRKPTGNSAIKSLRNRPCGN